MKSKSVSDLPASGPGGTSAAQLLNDSNWEERVAEARAKREKLLAEQAKSGKPKSRNLSMPRGWNDPGPPHLRMPDLPETAPPEAEGPPSVEKIQPQEERDALAALATVVHTAPKLRAIKDPVIPPAEPEEEARSNRKVAVLIAAGFGGLGVGLALGVGLMVGTGLVSPSQLAQLAPEQAAEPQTVQPAIVASTQPVADMDAVVVTVVPEAALSEPELEPGPVVADSPAIAAQSMQTGALDVVAPSLELAAMIQESVPSSRLPQAPLAPQAPPPQTTTNISTVFQADLPLTSNLRVDLPRDGFDTVSVSSPKPIVAVDDAPLVQIRETYSDLYPATYQPELALIEQLDNHTRNGLAFPLPTISLRDPIAPGRLVHTINPADNLPTVSAEPEQITLAAKVRILRGSVDDVALFVFAPPTVTDETLGAKTSVLEATGFPISEVTRPNFKVSQTHLRYYNAKDAVAAQSIAKEIGAEARDFTSTKAPEGRIEIWLNGTSNTRVRTARATPRRTMTRRAATPRKQVDPAAALRNQLIQRLRRGDHL